MRHPPMYSWHRRLGLAPFKNSQSAYANTTFAIKISTHQGTPLFGSLAKPFQRFILIRRMVIQLICEAENDIPPRIIRCEVYEI